MKYQTKQARLLFDYFTKIPGTHVTAGDVYRHFQKQGISIGQTTVYRQLERLVEEGLLHKYIIDENSPACFVYENPEPELRAEEQFHCKCIKCGRLIHLECEELREIRGHMLTAHHFLLDPTRTVFYGICDECLKDSDEHD